MRQTTTTTHPASSSYMCLIEHFFGTHLCKLRLCALLRLRMPLFILSMHAHVLLVFSAESNIIAAGGIIICELHQFLIVLVATTTVVYISASQNPFSCFYCLKSAVLCLALGRTVLSNFFDERKIVRVSFAGLCVIADVFQFL